MFPKIFDEYFTKQSAVNQYSFILDNLIYIYTTRFPIPLLEIRLVQRVCR